MSRAESAQREEDSPAAPGDSDAWPTSSSSDALARAHSPPARSFHCFRPYTGWLISYAQNTLSQLAVLNVTPNGNEGSFWMSGTAPAADANGNIFVLDANVTFDTTLNAQEFPSQGDFGNAFLKIATANKQLTVADYFEMLNQSSENSTDADLGSGGALVLPDLIDGSGQTRHLAVGAGKDAIIYLVDRDSMGKFNSSANSINRKFKMLWVAAYFRCLHSLITRSILGRSGAA